VVALLKTNELRKITGGWGFCACSETYSRYVHISENSCKQICCENSLLGYYKFGVNLKHVEMRYCSEEARMAAQAVLEEMVLMQELRANNFEISDSPEVII